MEWFAARRQLEKNTSTVLVSGIAKELQQLLNDRARRYRIMESTPTLYEVQSIQTLKEHLVDLNKQTCRCRYWQIKGYPCAHALAVLLYLKSDVHDYIKPFYTRCIPQNIRECNYPSFERRFLWTPRTCHRTWGRRRFWWFSQWKRYCIASKDSVPPGRPKKKRMRSQHGLEAESGESALVCKHRLQHCSRCTQPGHSKRTCTEVIWFIFNWVLFEINSGRADNAVWSSCMRIWCWWVFL